jgi:sugar transferase (PEP-CTERM system associated)
MPNQVRFVLAKSSDLRFSGRVVIRFLRVHYPVRALVLLFGEALMVWASLLLGTLLRYQQDSYLVLNFENGYFEIVGITAFILVLCHWFDLYEVAYSDSQWKVDMLIVLGLLWVILAFVREVFPMVMIGKFDILLGMAVLTISLPAWRFAYEWLAQQSYLRERVYILGRDERARSLVRGLEERKDFGFDLVGWSGDIDGVVTRDTMAAHMLKVANETAVDRIIIALQDRRSAMPMRELQDLRLDNGIRIEDATTWLEKIYGRIEIEELHPSWIIFAEGFRFSERFRVLRRALDCVVCLIGLLLAVPLIPFIMAAIMIDSPGPVFYKQQRVGRRGDIFNCYKFRTMRQDAEADIGPTWADDNDPRITKVGKFLRILRLDEIPQLWCVLKGDLAFVGPRPERPEFVEWLTEEISYYKIRHMVRPGITGWAQIRYKYGNSVHDAKEKLQYDLFYIKNASIGLDVFIMFQTIKTILRLRGAQ